MITDERLREIEQRAEKATAGPCDPRVGPTCTPSCWRNSPYCVRHERDLGIFEIAALSDIPDLIAALREARAENGRLREALLIWPMFQAHAHGIMLRAQHYGCSTCSDLLDKIRTALSRDVGREG